MYYGIRFMGFFVTDPENGTVVGQFPHLYPAAIAIGYGLDGLTGARHVSSLCAALGVVALFFLASRLVGRPAAAVAGVLLAVNVVQVWFARYPNSEIVAQLLILAGMLAFARAYIDGDRFFGPVAALLLGLSLFARIDGVFAIAAACAAAILLRLEGRPAGISFFGPTIATAAAGWLYFSRILAPYTQRPIGTAKQHLVALGALAAGVAAVYVATGRKAIAPFLHRWIPRALTVVLVGLAIYAFFFRVPSGRLAVHDANALRTYAWYVHPAALGVALIGLCLVTWKRFWRDPAWLLAVAFYSVFFFYKIQIVPEHFWMARRFLPVILPATMMCIGAVLMQWAEPAAVKGWRPGNVPRVALRLALAALIAWNFIESSRPILGHIEYAGIIPRLESLAARVGGDELLIVESRNASDLHVLALPLAYIYAQAGAGSEFAEARQARVREVRRLGAATLSATCTSSAAAARTCCRRPSASSPSSSERFQVPEYESRRNAYPTHVRHKEFDYGLYRFVDAGRDRQRVRRSTSATGRPVRRALPREGDATGAARSAGRSAQSYLSLPGVDPGDVTNWCSGCRTAAGRRKRRPARGGGVHRRPVDRPVVVGPALQPYSLPDPRSHAPRRRDRRRFAW